MYITELNLFYFFQESDQTTTVENSEGMEKVPMMDPEAKRKIFADIAENADAEESVSMDTERKKKVVKRRKNWTIATCFGVGFLVGAVILLCVMVPLITTCDRD